MTGIRGFIRLLKTRDYAFSNSSENDAAATPGRVNSPASLMPHPYTPESFSEAAWSRINA